MAEAQQVEIVLKDPEKRGCSAEIENSTLEKHTDDRELWMLRKMAMVTTLLVLLLVVFFRQFGQVS